MFKIKYNLVYKIQYVGSAVCFSVLILYTKQTNIIIPYFGQIDVLVCAIWHTFQNAVYHLLK